tara:strand:- start:262 stop:525 length:264 start_codon:yes stop_codon:yes gene_type:complete
MDEREERRNEWLDMLKGCSKYHRDIATDLAPTIIGQESSDEHIMHKVWHWAVKDAVAILEILPTMKEEVDVDVDDKRLPQHREGPIG